MQILSFHICIAIPFFCLWAIQQHRGDYQPRNKWCAKSVLRAWPLKDWVFRLAVASLAMAYVQKAFERLDHHDLATWVDIWRDASVLFVAVARVWQSVRNEARE